MNSRAPFPWSRYFKTGLIILLYTAAQALAVSLAWLIAEIGTARPFTLWTHPASSSGWIWVG